MKRVKYTLSIEQAQGHGQSCCLVCKCINWDSMMYKVKEFGDHRICGDCYRQILSKGEVIE